MRSWCANLFVKKLARNRPVGAYPGVKTQRASVYATSERGGCSSRWMAKILAKTIRVVLGCSWD